MTFQEFSFPFNRTRTSSSRIISIVPYSLIISIFKSDQFMNYFALFLKIYRAVLYIIEIFHPPVCGSFFCVYKIAVNFEWPIDILAEDYHFVFVFFYFLNF